MVEAPSAGIVMLVDDNPDTLRMLIDALEGVGLTALVARDAQSALGLLGRIEPDVILLDAVMPGMDGFELCRKIKENPTFVSTPVLFMTGLSDAENIVKGLRAGGVDYIIKPINPNELIARITNHVANARLIASARTVIDATDSAIIALTEGGRLAWQTSRAASEVETVTGLRDGTAALLACPRLQGWFQSSKLQPISEISAIEIPAESTGKRLQIEAVGRSASNETLCRVAQVIETDPVRQLEQNFALSQREAEVLLWITRGKANRDIADLLSISPRTVTKHVEQVLTKLGVENRTAAAVLAITATDLR